MGPFAKSIVGFIAPGVVVLVSAVQDSSAGGSNITTAEWVTAAAACVITAAGVYAVPNRDPRATHQEQSVQPPNAG